MKGKIILKRILYFTLILAILVPVLNLTSCDRKYDEEEVKTAAAKLLAESATLNDVLFGRGIRTIGGSNTNGAYYEADFLHLYTLGFSTVEELREKVRQTFSAEYSELIFSTVLSPISIDGVAYSSTRYYQLYADQINNTDPICIMVFRDYDFVFESTVEYDYESIRVTDVEKQTLFITVDATVTSQKGESQRREITFELIEQTDGWRINTHTYVNYNPYLDSYEDMNQPIK